MMKLMKSIIFELLILFIWLGLSYQTINDVNVKTIYSWKVIDFIFPDQQSRDEALKSGQFIPNKAIIMDSDVHISNQNIARFFVTTPIPPDVSPITLSEVTNEKNGDIILLKPFPSWEMNSKKSCESIIAVYRLQIDKCGNLWVADNGRIQAANSDELTCPPKILIYNLNNNDVEIARYELDEEAYRCNSHILNLIVESFEEDCSDSVAYIADSSGGLIIYDKKQNSSWRVQHQRFSFYPDDVIIKIDDLTLNTDDGVLGLALSPSTEDTHLLYWHSLGSLVESWISTSILKDREKSSDGSILNKEITTSIRARESQSTTEIMTDDGILIYVLISQHALACWNSATSFTKDNQHIIYQDEENLQFITGLKLRIQELIITSNTLQKVIRGTFDPNEINYQIISIDNVDKLLQGTPCKI